MNRTEQLLIRQARRAGVPERDVMEMLRIWRHTHVDEPYSYDVLQAEVLGA